MVVVTGTAPGTADIRNLPKNADVFVQGQGCVVNAEGNALRGDPDCGFTVAVIETNGDITRLVGTLASLDEDDEDRPTPLPEPTPADTLKPQIKESQAGERIQNNTADSKESLTNMATYLGVFLERDQGPFGFVGIGVGLGVRFSNGLRVGLSMTQSLGRAQTTLLEVDRSVEEELELVLLQVGYEYVSENRLIVYGEMNIGGGQLTSDSIADDRFTVSAATQSVVAYRPKIGLGWRNGPVDLGIAWQITFAEGRWYSDDAFGSDDGSGPPDNSGILSQGVQLEIGLNL